MRRGEGRRFMNSTARHIRHGSGTRSFLPMQKNVDSCTSRRHLMRRLLIFSRLSKCRCTKSPRSRSSIYRFLVASVALGACVIEKHLTLTRADGGSDAAFSLEPQEFIELVKSIRLVEQAMGTPSYKLLKGEKENIRFRKSLYVVRDIKKGEKFTKGNVRSIRPGYGLAPKFYSRVIGKCATRDIKRATPLSLGLLAK